jgi:hypothetical protein
MLSPATEGPRESAVTSVRSLAFAFTSPPPCDRVVRLPRGYRRAPARRMRSSSTGRRRPITRPARSTNYIPEQRVADYGMQTPQ